MRRSPFDFRPLAALIGLLSIQPAMAITFGIYDNRGLAMGGTAVAIGDSSQAVFYNPALLSFHNGDEDTTKDGRFYFPSLVAQATTTVDSALNAVNDHLDTKLTDAVTAFNAQVNATTAGAVSTASHDLRKVLDEIANKDLTADGFIGLSVSEPGDRQGGAFYLGARVIGIGTSNVPQEDVALLDEYIAVMDQIAAGASLASVALQHPKLVDNTGHLINPTKTLLSSADVGALAIGEWGLALSKEFTFWGQPVALGVTPKMMRVEAYRDKADFNDNAIATGTTGTEDFSNTKLSHMTFNADAGIATYFAEHYRVSFAVKDIFAKDFSTKPKADPVTGVLKAPLTIQLRQRSRLGLGYVNESFSVGLDYDIKASTPMANEKPTQEMSLGAEYKILKSLALRVGYRQDKTGGTGNLFSSGIGYQWGRFVVDLSYAQSSAIKAGGLQMGWAF